MRTFTVRDVKGDGNCFFRALYKSAMCTNNINTLIKQMNRYAAHDGSDITEDMFVAWIRRSLASYMRRPRGRAILRNIYDNMKSIRSESKATYMVMLESFPDWFVQNFRRLPATFEAFEAQFTKYVLRSGYWVSEIEVTIIMDMFRRVRIQLLNSPPLPKTTADPTVMYLLNEGEFHYKYIRCRKSKST